MRVGDFSVEVVPHGTGRVRELDSGHVLARPGQVYRLRLRNHGPLHCVVDVELDGQRVTAGGLVLAPWSVTELERPVDAGEDGRFTVVAEGDERVFGPDGGRDDPALGLVRASFRRELPRGDRDRDPLPPRIGLPELPSPTPRPMPGVPGFPGAPTSPRRFPELPSAPPEWVPPLNRHTMRIDASALDRVGSRLIVERSVEPFERAAGTGLTGRSDQRFTPIHLGPLETEATVIQLRLVIGTEDALASADAPRPLGEPAPARPAARP